MQKSLKKLFESNSFFAASAIISFVIFMLDLIAKAVSGIASGSLFSVGYADSMIVLLIPFTIAGLYISYRLHMKNLMKGLLGVLLVCTLLNTLSNLESHVLAGESGGIIVLRCLLCLLTLVFLVNHFIINSDRYPRPHNVMVNQIAVSLIFVLELVLMIRAFAVNIGLTGAVVFGYIASFLGVTLMLAFMCCIETKLDAYRIRRTDAGWTEETGYPEGYDRTANYGK